MFIASNLVASQLNMSYSERNEGGGSRGVNMVGDVCFNASEDLAYRCS